MINEIARMAKEMDIPFEWTQMTYLEVQAGNIALLIFALGTLLVYFVLAAKYESWRLPLAVILVVPLCMLAADCGHDHRPAARRYFRPDRSAGAGWTWRAKTPS